MEAENLGGACKLWPATAPPLPSAPLWHCLPPFSRFGTLYIAFYKYVKLGTLLFTTHVLRQGFIRLMPQWLELKCLHIVDAEF